MNFFERPAIGLIVEGHGEHKAFQTLISDILDIESIYIKLLNARGFGNITANLSQHLDDLVIHWQPHHIIITVDYCDIIENNICNTCEELLELLKGKIDSWCSKSENDERIKNTPTLIVPVIQIQKLETWLISDPISLSKIEYFNLDPSTCTWGNVDNDIQNPDKWINDRTSKFINTKSPSVVKSILSSHNSMRMRKNSNSFDKFYRTVSSCYELWLENSEEQAEVQ